MKVKFVVMVVIGTAVFLLLGWADWSWRLRHTKHPHRAPDPKREKTGGGDFFRAKIYTEKTKSSAPGRVRDYGNGTYGVTFRLPWAGDVTVSVRMVHSSSAVRVLKRLREEFPTNRTKRDLTAINSIIKVKKGTISTILVGHQDGDRTEQLPRCMPGLPAPVPSGYYRNGRWVSRVCQGPRLTNASDWKKCLQNSALDFLGDSTTRQWFYYTAKYMQMAVRNSPYFLSATAGPIYAEEKQWNITSRYQSHGPPINTFLWVNASILSNLVRIIDEIDEPNHIVVVTVGFHFNSHPLVDYVRRVRTVRSALLRLLRRQQNTTLVIKPTNTAASHILNVDDWFSFQMYLIIKEMFSGLPVVFVDTWEMTDCQFPKDTTHPADEVIQEEILYLLSYVCQ
ncbi:PREDICTED: NXPE family member 3-like [Branchiostoma belcheri]|uniref:NXPE family member 3-like n=1 Tax=Branchiostoma belcheri TaxID=7741 RepID=A0A6P4YK36_BRABE|nr:PREDICTED: NXPE family member 3-like [Branchiostoma belcheri]